MNAEKIESDLGQRFYEAFGPLGGGIMLDCLDVATFGYVGIVFGWLIGALVGWWISSFYKMPVPLRALTAFICACYLFTPCTELLPFATIVSVGARFFEKELAALNS